MIQLMTKVQRELKTVEKHSLQVQTLEMKTGVRTLVLKYTIELKEKKTTGIFSLLFQTFLIQILENSYYEIEDEDAYETIPTSDNVINKELNDTKTQITVSQEERVK